MTRNSPLSRRVLTQALALSAALFLGCQGEPPKPEEAHPAPVKWEPAEKADLEEWTELIGTTQTLPGKTARISAAVEGRVLEVLPADNGKPLVEGQEVEPRQVLVRLDDHVLQANRAKLVAAEAEMRELIKQAAYAVELAQIDVERWDRLQADRSGSPLPLVSRIDLEKARVVLKEALSKHEAAQAHLKTAQAELKALDEQISLFTLRSPIKGRLGLVHAVPGQTLSVGTVVAEVIDLDAVDVLCFVPARTAALLRLGKAARLEGLAEVGSDSDKAPKGQVVFIGEQAQAETGTVAVKVRFANRDVGLRANTLRRVRVLTNKKADCLTVPESALLEDQEEPAVLVVETEEVKKEGKEEEEHHVHKFLVKLGLRDRDRHRVEVLGLVNPKTKKDVPVDAKTLFVVEHGHGLEDDDLVSLKKEEHEEHDEHKEEAHK